MVQKSIVVFSDSADPKYSENMKNGENDWNWCSLKSYERHILLKFFNEFVWKEYYSLLEIAECSPEVNFDQKSKLK